MLDKLLQIAKEKLTTVDETVDVEGFQQFLNDIQGRYSFG